MLLTGCLAAATATAAAAAFMAPALVNMALNLQTNPYSLANISWSSLLPVSTI